MAIFVDGGGNPVGLQALLFQRCGHALWAIPALQAHPAFLQGGLSLAGAAQGTIGGPSGFTAAKEIAVKPVRRLACLAALALMVAGCSYGYAPPYTRYGTGPEVTLAAPAPQGVR